MIEVGRIIIKNSLRAVTVMNVPVDDRDALDFFVTRLRITRGNRYIIEDTKTHRAICRGMMTGRTHRNKSVACLAAHYRINRLTRSAGAAQSGFKRIDGNDSVRVKKSFSFANYLLDVFEMLRRMTRLHNPARSFVRFDLAQFGPQLVASQRIHDDAIALRPLRMTSASVM